MASAGAPVATGSGPAVPGITCIRVAHVRAVPSLRPIVPLNEAFWPPFHWLRCRHAAGGATQCSANVFTRTAFNDHQRLTDLNHYTSTYLFFNQQITTEGYIPLSGPPWLPLAISGICRVGDLLPIISNPIPSSGVDITLAREAFNLLLYRMAIAASASKH